MYGCVSSHVFFGLICRPMYLRTYTVLLHTQFLCLHFVLSLPARYVPAQKDDDQKRQETVSVFEEILADIQGDIAYEDSLVVKEKSQRKQQDTDKKKASTVPKPTLGPRIDVEPVYTSVAMRQRSSSALVTGVERDSSSGRSLSLHPRSMSFTSSGSSAGPLYQHHHRCVCEGVWA